MSHSRLIASCAQQALLGALPGERTAAPDSPLAALREVLHPLLNASPLPPPPTPSTATTATTATAAPAATTATTATTAAAAVALWWWCLVAVCVYVRLLCPLLYRLVY